MVRHVADNFTESQGREILIEELSNIVAANARSATHTVFSDISSHQALSIGSFKTKQRYTARRASTFMKQTSPTHMSNAMSRQHYQDRPKRLLCGSNHWLSHCSNYERKSFMERMTFVQLRGLCGTCLLPTFFFSGLFMFSIFLSLVCFLCTCFSLELVFIACFCVIDLFLSSFFVC